MKPALKIKKTFSLLHFVEPLEHLPDFKIKRMFGCIAIYAHGKTVLLLAENTQEKDWNGVLIPTYFEHQESIQKEFKMLTQHTLLKKWLYLPMNDFTFEETLEKITDKILKNDFRFGILPIEKKKSIKSKKKNLK